jgi:hypothetical protein
LLVALQMLVLSHGRGEKIQDTDASASSEVKKNYIPQADHERLSGSLGKNALICSIQRIRNSHIRHVASSYDRKT